MDQFSGIIELGKIPLFALLVGLMGLAGLMFAGSAPAGQSPPPAPGLAKATLAGGCFWCVESTFDKLDGVIYTTSGYTGGKVADPSYEQVSSGDTGHAEAVEVVFDPAKVSYEKILEVFWRNIDPTVKDGQFCDFGSQYRTAIFYHDQEQKRLAEKSLERVKAEKGFAVYTEIIPAEPFYPAEDYHQDYYKKNPLRYKLYHAGCGRDARLKEIWGKD